MSISLNKTVKKQIVNKAIEAKFKPKYEKALSNLTVAARCFAVENSFDEYFKSLNLSVEQLKCIMSKSEYRFDDDIYVANVIFINQRYISQVEFEPVLGHYGDWYFTGGDVKEHGLLCNLVKQIISEQEELTNVIMSYRNVKKLIADLPWVEKYLPAVTIPSTGLIAIEAINDINAKFGG